MDEKKNDDPDEAQIPPHRAAAGIDGIDEAAPSEASEIEEDFATAPDVGV